MPIVKLPSGEVVNVAEGTSPERIQQIMRENPAKAAPKRAATPAPPAREKMGIVPAMLALATRGVTANFDDEIGGGLAAATKGTFNAIRHGDISEIGKTYRGARDQIRTENAQAAEDHPFLGTVAEIAGALRNPLGRFASTGANVAARVVPKVAPLVAKARNSGTLVKAVGTGAGYGAVDAAGAARELSDVPGDTVGGAIVGGLGGGTMGAAVHGGRKAIQLYRDHLPESASRIAYRKVAEMLGRAPRATEGPGATMMHTPTSAERAIRVGEGRGTETVLADLAPSLQTEAGSIAQKAHIPASNGLVATSRARMANRGEALQNQVEGSITPPTGVDAHKFQATNTASRKAAGQRDYEAALDKPIAWSPELDAFVQKPNPLVQTALKSAYQAMRSQDIDPTTIGLKFGKDGILEKVEKPTMRAFDYLKRGLDRVGGIAKREGDGDTARIAGDQVGELKKLITDVNPEYGTALSTQRAFFQQDAAAELGKSVAKRITKEPRILLDELKAVHADDFDALRTGFADSLISLRDKVNPVNKLQALMRSPNQRKVLEHLFEGRGNLGRFEKWLSRELRASRTDALVAGPQSATNKFSAADAAADENPFIDISTKTLKGNAFGGPVGGAAGLITSLRDATRRTGQTTAVRNEIGKILGGKGVGLKQGVDDAAAFYAARKRSNDSKATATAKAIAQMLSGQVGN